MNLFFSPREPVVVAPLPEQRYRIVATLDDAPERPGAADVPNLLDTRGAGAAPAGVEEVVWSSRFRVHPARRPPGTRSPGPPATRS